MTHASTMSSNPRSRELSICLCLLLAAAMTACDTGTKPTPENYLKAINLWLPDHPDCLLDGSITFPYETSDPARTGQMDTLVKEKILEAGREPAMHVSRYTVTPAGERAGKNLCFGHRVATEIVSSTPPASANGFTETQVVYRYKLMEKPVWADSADVAGAFPRLAEESTGTATAKITLALTRVGWSVPD